MNPFDLNTMHLDRIVLILGKEREKEQLLEEIKYFRSDKIDKWHVWTYNQTDKWKKQMALDRNGKQNIYDSIDPKDIQPLLVNRRRNGHYQIVLDNVILNQKFWFTTEIRSLFYSCRHYQSGVILSSIIEVPVSLRCSISYVFCFWNSFVRERKRMFEHFRDHFKSFSEFEQILQNEECLVLDRIQDKVYSKKYRIILPEFRLRNESPPPKHTISFLRFSRLLFSQSDA